MRKLFVLSGFVVAIVLGLAWMRHAPDAQSSPQNPPSSAEIHGELIQSVTLAGSEPANQQPTNNLPRRKHPKPPSVQRRMILVQLADRNQANADDSALPAGTLGTAADLAKTNLVSASDLPPLTHLPSGLTEISFSVLSDYNFSLTKEVVEGSADPARAAAEVRAQIPANIQSLDGKSVAIQGFLLPVKMDDGLTVEFLLMRNQSMCCYGVPPKINEWITVKMIGRGVKPVMDQPIVVFGTLHVGPIEENGLLTGIYSLDGERVLGAF